MMLSVDVGCVVCVCVCVCVFFFGFFVVETEITLPKTPLHHQGPPTNQPHPKTCKVRPLSQ